MCIDTFRMWLRHSTSISPITIKENICNSRSSGTLYTPSSTMSSIDWFFILSFFRAIIPFFSSSAASSSSSTSFLRVKQFRMARNKCANILPVANLGCSSTALIKIAHKLLSAHFCCDTEPCVNWWFDGSLRVRKFRKKNNHRYIRSNSSASVSSNLNKFAFHLNTLIIIVVVANNDYYTI